MDSQNPYQIQAENSENPRRKPSEETAETEKHRKKAANMEKLKEAVMKLLNVEANTHLSETRKVLVQDRVTQFISLLHSPDHPPYAWMIEKALRELNEEGGSLEDSILKFIREKYDDLPWAHYTMLKHHLVQLCESGEVVMTRGKRYLLAGTNSDLKTRKNCRRKPVKRKKSWDWEKKRSKRRRKVTGKVNMSGKVGEDELVFSQQKDQVTLNEIHEEEGYMVEGNKQPKLKSDNVSSQQNSCGTSNEVHDVEDFINEQIEQQKLDAKVRKDTEELSVAGENFVSCNSYTPYNLSPSLLITDGKEKSQKLSVHQQSSKHIAGITEICCLIEQQEQGGKQLEDNKTELSTLERPPGFESVILEEVYCCQPQAAVSSKLPIHNERLKQDAHDFSSQANKAPVLCDIEESFPTEHMQRQMKRWANICLDNKLP